MTALQFAWDYRWRKGARWLVGYWFGLWPHHSKAPRPFIGRQRR